MRIHKADNFRRLQLAGVPGPVSRPVDIDQQQTGFSVLRSLRIYRFDAESVIDGHAEDDEVLIIILAGSVRLTLSQHEVEEDSSQFRLSAVDDTDGHPCAAYLPPHGAYRLIPHGNAEVAYARATASTTRPPQVFSASARSEPAGEHILFEEASYPVHLRIRIAEIRAGQGVEQFEPSSEVLAHVRTRPEREAVTLSGEDLQPLALESWDTVSLLPGERAALVAAPASSARVLTVFASR